MFIPIFTLAGVVNIIAQNYNYNVNITRNPDFDIRVRRSLDKYEKNIIQPEENDNQPKETSSDESNEIPLLLDILKGRKEAKKDDIVTKVKRDIYKQNTQIYNGYTTDGNFNNGNGNNGNLNGNSKMGHFKANPDFIGRAYNKFVQVIGLATQTTPRYNSAYTNNDNIHVNNNGYLNQNGNQMTNNDRFYNPFNTTNYNNQMPYANNQITFNTSAYNTNANYNNGYNGFNTSPNNSIPYATYNNQFNNFNASANTYFSNNFNTAMNTTYNRNNGTSFVPNTNNDRRNRNNGTVLTTTTEKIIATSCIIMCNTFTCPENQKRVGFRCVDLNYDYYQ